MLEDFIQANNLKAKILGCAKRADLVKCDLFSTGSDFILLVRFASDTVKTADLKERLGLEHLQRLTGLRAEEVTGYSAEFLPPISIYGMRVIVDERVLEKPVVHCLAAEDKTLEISPQEIVEANEGAEAIALP
jgi:prolyl-tRNA editing enzyme YbaK/EbsC (Cys-tRNA(Pro) deacylase)